MKKLFFGLILMILLVSTGVNALVGDEVIYNPQSVTNSNNIKDSNLSNYAFKTQSGVADLDTYLGYTFNKRYVGNVEFSGNNSNAVSSGGVYTLIMELYSYDGSSWNNETTLNFTTGNIPSGDEVKNIIYSGNYNLNKEVQGISIRIKSVHASGSSVKNHTWKYLDYTTNMNGYLSVNETSQWILNDTTYNVTGSVLDNEGSNDGTGSGKTFNDGTITGATYTTDSAFGDYALSFDGSGDKLDVGDINITKKQTSFWLNFNDLNDQLILQKFQAGAENKFFGLTTNRFRIYCDSGSIYHTNTEVNAGEWHFYSINWNNGTVYLDGNFLFDGNDCGGIDGTGHLLISPTNNLDAIVDKFTIYDRILSNSEIADMYANGTTSGYKLTGQWDFEEGSGSTAKDTNHLIDNSLFYNKGFTFDGDDDRIQIADDNTLDLTTNFTICSWIYPREYNKYILSKADGGSVPYGFWIDTEGDLRMIFYNAGFTQVESSLRVSLNTWNFVCSRITSNNVDFTLDSQSESVSETFTLAQSSAPLYIGANGNALGTADFNGSISDIRIYNRSLEDYEIEALYLLGLNESTPVYLNVTAINNKTGAKINTFTATISNDDYTLSIPVIDGEALFTLNSSTPYNLTISGTSIATASEIITLSETYTHIIKEVYDVNSVRVFIYDQENNTLLNGTSVTVSFISDDGQFSNTTTTGEVYAYNLNAGDYELRIVAANYEISRYFITVTNFSTQSVNTYLLPTGAGETILSFKDSNIETIIEGVTLSIEQIINDEWVLINILTSDISGRVVFNYQESAKYRFSTYKLGYADKTFTLDPIIFSSYNIWLDKEVVVQQDQDYNRINIKHSPEIFYNDANNTISFSFISPDGEFESYGFNFTYKTNVVSGSGVNALGETFSGVLNIENATVGDRVYLYYYYKLSDGSIKIYTFPYTISNTNLAGTFAYNRGNTYGLGLFERTLITSLIAVGVAGSGYLFGGLLSAGLLTMLVFGYINYIGFLSGWITIPTMILIFIITSWEATR